MASGFPAYNGYCTTRRAGERRYREFGSG